MTTATMGCTSKIEIRELRTKKNVIDDVVAMCASIKYGRQLVEFSRAKALWAMYCGDEKTKFNPPATDRISCEKLEIQYSANSLNVTPKFTRFAKLPPCQ